MNRFNADEMFELTYRAALAAVQEVFPHLTLAQIVDPPQHMFDAALARQVAMHLTVARFDVPKRRFATLLGRSREAINRALRTIDWRLDQPEFEALYRRAAARAATLIDEELRRAA